MTFSIDFVVTSQEPPQTLTALTASGTALPADLSQVRDLTGFLALDIDGQTAPDSYEEPMLRLVDLWLRKIPWIVGGDTETVALRNSAHCFAFVPAGQSVEVSFYAGTESEIEESLLEGATVRIDVFVAGVLALGDRVWALARRLGNAPQGGLDDPLNDLQLSLEEAKRAWHDHQLHQRR